MKKKIVGICLAALLSFSMLAVSAQTDILSNLQSEYHIVKNSVTVSCDISGAHNGDIVTAFVVPEDAPLTDELLDAVVGIAQLTLNGTETSVSLEVKINPAAESGSYYALAGTGGYSCKSEPFQYVNNNQALAELNAAATAAQLESWLKSYGELFALDTDVYQALGVKQIRFEEGLVSARPYVSVAVFKVKFDKMLAALKLEDLSGDEAAAYLAEQEETLELTGLPYYGELKDKALLAKFLIGQVPFESPADFDAKASVGSRIKLLSELRWSAEKLDDIISTLAKDLVEAPFRLEMDMDGFNELKSDKKETPVLQAITGVGFASPRAFVTAFNNAVDENSGTGGGNSSGGGGGSMGSGNKGGGSIGISNKDKDDQTNQPEPSYRFTDLSTVPWAVESIENLAARGIINGRTATLFDPHANVSRAEYVKMLVLAFDLYEEGSVPDFNDVGESDWYASYAASAQMNGIVKGDESGNFNGPQLISREDAAVMLDRIMEQAGMVLNNGQLTENFQDRGQISSYALFSVERLQRQGIVSGAEDNRFLPKGNTTRAEAAKMLYTVVKDR